MSILNKSQPVPVLSLIARRYNSPLGLPSNFPNVEAPRFHYGDYLSWISADNPPDRGRVVGTFYGFAPHRRCWQWCYLIWLDAGSPSAPWITADIAWEDDLEAQGMEPD
jgi:hypothetical protein